MSSFFASIAGLPAFALTMGVASLSLWTFMNVYTKLTPYNEKELIKAGNLAASISYSGTLLGFVLAIASAVRNSVGLLDLIVWSCVAGAVQIAVFRIMLRAYPDLPRRITDAEIAPAMKLAALSLGAGLLNAASMTY